MPDKHFEIIVSPTFEDPNGLACISERGERKIVKVVLGACGKVAELGIRM